MLKRLFQAFLENKYAVVTIITGTLLWSLTMVKSGIVYDYGMGFWGPNGHDGIWHVAVINSLAKGGFEMPVFAGENIKNYHIGFDLLLSIIHRITLIPVINLYFQIIPPIIAFSIGAFVYKFVYLWQKSKIKATAATFFIYFSGSFGWIGTFFRGEGFGGESLFWSQQSLSTLVNPPFAFSLVVIFLGLFFYIKYKNTNNILYIILYTISFSLLVQVKVYAGILMLISLLITGLWQYTLNKVKRNLLIVIVVGIVSLVILLPTYDFRSGGLIFQPFWFLESMVATVDRLYWPKMASAVANYKLAGVYLKLIPSYALLFTIFLLGNMGVRFISLPWFIKKIINIRSLNDIDVIILSIVSFGILIPTLFIQTGNSWNSIQFFYYSLVLFAVIAGVVVGEYWEKLLKNDKIPIMKIITIMTVMLVLSIPSSIATLRHYLPSRPPAMVSTEELKALEFLKNQPEGVVLTIPFDRKLADKEISNPPRPLYLYESTAYVSALSGKVTYLEDEVNLEITGYNGKGRKEEILNKIPDINYLRNKGVNYIYLTPLQDFSPTNLPGAQTLYESGGYVIYKI